MRVQTWMAWSIVLSVMVAVPVRVALAEKQSSCLTISRATLVPCALAAGLAIRREHRDKEVRDARVVAARRLVPSNPVLSGSLAHREAAGTNLAATNWTASLSQEFELAGQRGARLRAADGEVLAQRWRIAATERETAAYAWLAYFEVVAAREELVLAERLEQSAKLMAKAARARADQGLLSEVDADVVEATLVRIQQSRVQATARLRSSQSMLTTITGGDPSAPQAQVVQGDLSPLAGVDALSQSAIDRIKRGRPEVQALREEERAFEARASLYRRARVPNPTVSLFAQNDGYNERVYGVGLAFPIPLPAIGRTYAGEIAEAEAEARRTSTERERIARDAGLELVRAAQDLEAKKEELALFTDERAAKAERALIDIVKEIEGGRLSVRDAVVAQDRLIELLRAKIDVKHSLCVASVTLSRTAGVPLERGAR